MKNLFGVTNKGNNFSKFVVRSPSATSKAKIDEFDKKARMVEKKKSGPGLLNALAALSLCLGLLFIVGMIAAKDGFKEALKTRGYIFYIGIVLFAFGLVYTIYMRIKSKKIDKSEMVENILKEKESIKRDVLDELGVPANAVIIDILITRVKENKDGKEVVKSMGLFTHLNSEVYFFVENDKACFADYSAVIEIPLESFKSADKIDKRIIIPTWHKEVPYNNEKYKEYKIKRNGYDMFYVKPYYSIKLLIDNDDYEMLIPNYDLKEFLKVVPLNVNE